MVALRILIMSWVLGVKEGLSSLDIWVIKYTAESGNLNSVRLSRVERNLNKENFTDLTRYKWQKYSRYFGIDRVLEDAPFE